MNKSVWKYGLLSGLALAGTMGLTVPFEHHIAASHAMAIGYTLMVLSFLVVFTGVKHYRDYDCGGAITFGRAFVAGALMMLIACVCYVAMWEVLTATVERNFAHDYAAGMIQHAQHAGLTGADLERKVAEAHAFEAQYANPLYRMSMTLLEPLPVGLVMALVTAGILRRRRHDDASGVAGPEAVTG